MPADDVQSDAPQLVRDLALSCTRFVSKAVGVALDFTQDTLPLLDHYLREAADSDDEILGLVVPAAGAYFGEVLRAHLGTGRWIGVGADYEAFRLVIDPGPLSMNPIGVVYECVTGAPAEGGGFDVPTAQKHVLGAAMKSMGEVRESDFYTLAIRFEAVEQIHATLLRLSENAPN